MQGNEKARRSLRGGNVDYDAPPYAKMPPDFYYFFGIFLSRTKEFGSDE
jgi:phage terminase large subunit-like protein